MARLRHAGLFCLASLALALVGCSGKDPYNPGEPVGSFHVSATLVSSTCGSAPSPWEFDVKLRHEASTVYWVQGSVPVQARVDADARVVFESGTQETLRAADARQKTQGCTMTREDTVDVVLVDAAQAHATDPASTAAFSGTISYRFAPTSDSDCTDQLTASGGGFDAVPCEVHYDLSATRTGDAKP